MRVKRAEKYGFCAGVQIADQKVKRFAQLGGTGGKILGQVVHNERVVEEMEDLGVPTVQALEEAQGGTIVFSAHGVPPSFHENARDRGLKILYQTTLNAEDFEDVVLYIESKTSDASRADTICYATKENQDAARELCADAEVDLILIVGGKQSANTRHLWELCQENKLSYLIQGPGDLQKEWFKQAATVGITAGASTPDYVVDEVEQAVAEIETLQPIRGET